MSKPTRRPTAPQREVLARLAKAHARVVNDRASLQRAMEARAKIAAEAREAGCTWAMIGEPMDLAHQNAYRIVSNGKKRERLEKTGS